MKRYLFIALAAACLLSSCASQENGAPVRTDPPTVASGAPEPSREASGTKKTGTDAAPSGVTAKAPDTVGKSDLSEKTSGAPEPSGEASRTEKAGTDTALPGVTAKAPDSVGKSDLPEETNGAPEPSGEASGTKGTEPDAALPDVTTRMPEFFPMGDAAEEFDSYERPAADEGASPVMPDSYFSESAGSESYDYTYDTDDSDCVVFPPFPPRQQPEARAGLLTGGEWRDNDHFDFWCGLFKDREDWSGIADSWRLCTTNRVSVLVTKDGNPAENVTVKLFAGEAKLWEAVTDNRGAAYLFATLDRETQYVPTHITAERGGKQLAYAEYRGGGECAISITEESPRAAGLDLMFAVDTTGSMGDELNYLQAELEGVIRRVTGEKQISARLGLNFYRDEGDEYVVRGCDFTSDIPRAIKVINEQSSYGGGDYPEAVEKALSCAIREQSWNADSVKLLFLVLDAPPHYTAENTETLRALLTEAAEKGIRIIPVASSGVDTETEFLCRSFATATGGTYTFLTDHSGIGGSHLEPTIGYYQVEKLNDMLVRIIEGYLSR